MTVFEDHSPGMGNATLDKPIPAPPADRLAALVSWLPGDIAEALALTPYQGRDREGGRPARLVTRTLTWD